MDSLSSISLRGSSPSLWAVGTVSVHVIVHVEERSEGINETLGRGAILIKYGSDRGRGTLGHLGVDCGDNGSHLTRSGLREPFFASR